MWCPPIGEFLSLTKPSGLGKRLHYAKKKNTPRHRGVLNLLLFLLREFVDLRFNSSQVTLGNAISSRVVELLAV